MSYQSSRVCLMVLTFSLLSGCGPSVQTVDPSLDHPESGVPTCAIGGSSNQEGSGDTGGSIQFDSGQPLLVTFKSPFWKTEVLELSGQLLPTGPWMYFPDSKVTGASTLTRDYCIPASTTAIVINGRALGDQGAEAYSCREDRCGKVYADPGLLEVYSGSRRITGVPIPNGLGCGCNIKFDLK